MTDAFCDENGNLDVVCIDPGNYLVAECTGKNSNGSVCLVKPDSMANLDTNSIIQEFKIKSEQSCSDINTGKLDPTLPKDYWTLGHNPIDFLDSNSTGTPVDTASFTLENYAKQFAEPEKEYSYDSHVIALRILPTSEVSYATNDFAIRSATPAEVAKYFPMTSTITGEDFNTGFCEIHTITIPGHIYLAPIPTSLTESTDEILFDFISAKGECETNGTDYSEIFLVKDCEGIVNEYSLMGGNFIDHSLWTCDENGVPSGRENGPYGEWIRADLLQ